MALASADYTIIYLDVGCKGRISDGGVFNQSDLSRAIEKTSLNIAPDCTTFRKNPICHSR